MPTCGRCMWMHRRNGSTSSRSVTARLLTAVLNIWHLELLIGWLGSRVVSVLDSDAEWPRFKSQLRRCRVTVLGKLFTSIMPVFTKQQNWVTVGLVESNGSLPPGLLLTSPAGWLPRTRISSGTLLPAVEYGLPLSFLVTQCAPKCLLPFSVSLFCVS